MPRPKHSGKTRRLNLMITEEADDRLQRLKEQSEALSMTEVIVRALAAYEVLLDARDDRANIIIRDDDGERQLIVI